MGMSSEEGQEMGIEQARKALGPLADRARYAGQVTYLTRNGRRIAAVVPLDRIKEPAMTYTVKRSEDDPREWVVMANDHTPAGWVSPGRKQPWGEQQWRGVVVGGTVACDDAYDRDDAAEQVMKVWREQEDADAEAEAEAAEAEQRAEPLRRGRPEIGPRFQMRLSPELRARVEAEARPGEKLADTIRRRLAARVVPDEDTLVTLRVPNANQAERLRHLIRTYGAVGIPFPNNTTHGWKVVDENGDPVNTHAIPNVKAQIVDA